MKKIIGWIISLTMAITLIGCSDNSKTTDIGQMTDVAGDAPLPTLYIQTKDQGADALDFVTKPVSEHVSEQIASWTPDYVYPPAPYYEECSVSLKDAKATLLLDAVDAEVKARGNWTTTYDKKALRIRFAEKQSMLELNDGAQARNWLLLAEYKDGSMLRNKTALSISREILEKDGLYASDAELVEVYINEQYWGIYLLAEMQQINENRVNITEAEKDYTGTDIGYLLEFDGYFYTEDPLQQFHVDYADNAALIPYDGMGGSGAMMRCLPVTSSDSKTDVGFTIVSDIYSQEQHDFIASYVNNIYRIMYEAAYNDTAYEFNDSLTNIVKSDSLTPREAIEKVVDVQSLVDLYIISELTCDADIYWSSFYMSVDMGANGNGKLTFTAPWDFDSAMGNKNRCAKGKGFYASNIVPDVNGGPGNGGSYETMNPWLVVLAYEEWYQDMIKETWTNAYDDGVFDRACEMIVTDTAQYSDAFARNYEKWDNIAHSSFANELSRQAAACKTHAEAAQQLLEWLQNRVAFLNEQWHL